MARTIPVTTSDTRLTDVIRELEQSEGPIEIEENGKTIAVLLSPSEYQVLTAAGTACDRRPPRTNPRQTPDEIARLVTEIVEEVRQEMYEEKLARSGGR